jgi:hypothetical protein
MSDSNDDDGDGKSDKPKKPSSGKGDYRVGYKRPPLHTRYQPGECGNPKGRPKGSKNTSTLLAEELNRRMSVTESGKRQRITKGHAIVKRAVNTAISDAKVGLSMLQNLQRSEAPAAHHAAVPPLPSGPEQDRVFEEFLRRVRASNPDEMISPDDDDGGGPEHYE